MGPGVPRSVGDPRQGVLIRQLQGLAPPGVVVAYAGPNPPAGWLLCDGAEVSRSRYARLFQVIGTTYGVGDGSTTFNVPDLRGRAVYGKGTHSNVDTLGESEGAAVGSRTPWHNHGSEGGTSGGDTMGSTNSRAVPYLVMNWIVRV